MNRNTKRQRRLVLVLVLSLLFSPMPLVLTRVSAEGTNLVKNGSFEEGLMNWDTWPVYGEAQLIIAGEDAPDGNKYARHLTNSGGHGLTQVIDVEPNTVYKLVFNAKTPNPGSFWIGVKDFNKPGKEGELYPSLDGGNEWTEYEIEFTTGSNNKTATVYTWALQGATGYVDNVQVYKIGAIPIDKDELMSAIELAESKVEDEYTEDSWVVLQDALTEAKAILGNDNATQEEVNEAVTVLQTAISKLVKVGEAVTYYVDPKGDDSADGKSPETAWKTLAKASQVKLFPGDKLLLKAGGVWNGEQLKIVDARGTESDPIVIGMYGKGPKPVLNGQGAKWPASNNNERSTVHILNSEYITVENLEVTNLDGDDVYKYSRNYISGMVVENRNGGELKGITIKNNIIHHVNSAMAGGGNKAAGGLIVTVTGNKVHSWYTDLKIEGNEVYDVSHEAIYLASDWSGRNLVGGITWQTPWIGWKNVYIANNYVHHTAGDGIVIINTEDALVEYNLLDNVASNDFDNRGNPAHAGLWMWNANNVTVQYNEVRNTEQPEQDGMAFDFDYGTQNCLYQYNLSYNNKGGFLMVCPSPDGYSINNVARYNVSINDGTRIIRLGGGKDGGIQIYNNTIYWTDPAIIVEQGTWGGPRSAGTDIFNNIFYGPDGYFAKNTGINYSNNLAFGGCQVSYARLANDPSAVLEDPKFVDVKDVRAGSFANGLVKLGRAEGFMLQTDSPAINAGKEIPDAPAFASPFPEEQVPTNIVAPKLDFYGNPLFNAEPDIGAHETNVMGQVEGFKLTYDPSIVEVGEEAVITITAQQVADLAGFDVRLSYDEDLLELKKVVFNEDFGFSKHLNKDGIVRILASLLGQDSGINGDVELAKLVFTAKDKDALASITILKGSQLSDIDAAIYRSGEDIIEKIAVAKSDITGGGTAIDDLVLVAKAFDLTGDRGVYDVSLDMNKDGVIDIVDVAYVAARVLKR